jgi:hypothetical protein
VDHRIAVDGLWLRRHPAQTAESMQGTELLLSVVPGIN